MTFNDGKDLIIEYFCLQVVYKSVVISLQRIIFDHVDIFSIDQITVLCKPPSFVLHSCKTIDKDILLQCTLLFI